MGKARDISDLPEEEQKKIIDRRERARKYREELRKDPEKWEKHKESIRKSWHKNKEKYLPKKREYYAKNKAVLNEKIRLYYANYWPENKDRINADRRQKWKDKNSSYYQSHQTDKYKQTRSRIYKRYRQANWKTLNKKDRIRKTLKTKEKILGPDLFHLTCLELADV